MEVIAKFINDKYDSKNFSIYKDTNKEQFNKLLDVISNLENKGLKTSLKLNNKFKNTIYINFMDKYDRLGNFEIGKKYKLFFKDLPVNEKGYVNFKLCNYELIEEDEKFGNLL